MSPAQCRTRLDELLDGAKLPGMDCLRLPIAFALFALCVACPNPAGEGEGEGVTYYPTVGTILNENCVACHQQGGIAPFPLDSYEAAQGWGDLVKVVSGLRSMPPWGMDETGECNTFHDTRALSEADIATLAAWADDGKLEGDPADAPTPPPGLSGIERVDATLSPNADYVPDQNVDDYRCFVVDPDNDVGGRFLTGYGVVPGAPEIVHHVIVYRIPASSASVVETLDANQPGPGYTCFGGPGLYDADVLIGWAPGSGATDYPAGTGIRLDAGDRFVMQVHYNPAAASGQSDRTTLQLKLADAVAEEAFLTIWADTSLRLPPGEPEYWFSYTQPVGGDVKVYGLFPHMHQLGRDMEIYASGGGDDRCIAKVPRYDFNWQRFYFYEEPLEIGAAANINVNCGYDTTSRTSTTFFGEDTTDEMCVVLWYYTLN